MQGRHAELVAELAAEVARFPLRERLRRQSMLALYRSGRHADALAVYQDFRRKLDDELGLEPSLELRELQGLILNQDPSLELPRGATPGASWSTSRLRRAPRGPVTRRWPAAHGRRPRRPSSARSRTASRPRRWRAGRRRRGSWATATRAWTHGRARSAPIVRRGDPRSAARAAAWLAYDTVVFRGDDAVAQGWFGHAHRLLADGDDGEEHGWLAFLEGEVALVAHGDTGASGRARGAGAGGRPAHRASWIWRCWRSR